MNDVSPIILNLMYSGAGGLMLIVFSWLGARMFSASMGFKIRDELKAGNTAVGMAMLGIFMGMGVGLGLVIGMGLN